MASPKADHIKPRCATVLTFLCLGICRMLMRSSLIKIINAVFDVNAGVIVGDDNILFLNCVFILRSSKKRF